MNNTIELYNFHQLQYTLANLNYESRELINQLLNGNLY